MLIDVIPHSLLAKGLDTLTYRTTENVVPGQLVMIPLRRRTIPGIVRKCNVQAGTSRQVLPIESRSSLVLPETYIRFIEATARYYFITPAQAWRQLMPNLDRHYLTLPSDQPDQQHDGHIFITPAQHSPSVKALKPHYQPLSFDTIANRRRQWHAAHSGQQPNLYGQLSLFGLPYSRLNQIIIDQPFTVTYRSDRAPGFSAPVLSCLLAASYQAELVIRSVLPQQLLARRLPLPPKTRLIKPKLHPIQVRMQKSGRYLNADLLAEVAACWQQGQRVLIIDNRTKKLDQTRIDLTKRLGDLTGRLEVRTVSALNEELSADQIIILNIDRLWSTSSPTSILAALETLAIFASRAPVLAQSFDNDSPLAAMAGTQLDDQHLAGFNPPHFDHRIVIAKPRRQIDVANRDDVKKTIGQYFGLVSDLPNSPGACWFLIPKTLTNLQRQVLTQLNGRWRLTTDAYDFPLVKEEQSL